LCSGIFNLDSDLQGAAINSRFTNLATRKTDGEFTMREEEAFADRF
jgi:hypothetical protein